MSTFEQKKLDMELKNFATRNFERPSDCRNLGQIRFYISELCNKIEEYEDRFHYVPSLAYTLLAQYNHAQNRILNFNFRETYC